jgi:hypothetical protein
VGENGTGRGDKGTTHPTDTVKGMDMATGSDAFGITSLICERSVAFGVCLEGV